MLTGIFYSFFVSSILPFPVFSFSRYSFIFLGSICHLSPFSLPLIYFISISICQQLSVEEISFEISDIGFAFPILPLLALLSVSFLTISFSTLSILAIISLSSFCGSNLVLLLSNGWH